MKKLLLLTLAAIVAFSLNSCKKDDGGDDPKPKEMRYVKSIYRTQTDYCTKHELEYDDQHRLVKVTKTLGPQNTISNTTYFSYTGNTVIITNDNLGWGDTKVQLNDMGYMASVQYMYGNHSTYVYTYNTDGYLQSETHSNDYYTTTTPDTYHWENGNITQMIASDVKDGYDNYEYGPMLYPNININLFTLDDVTYSMYELLFPQGRNTTNLPTKIIHGGESAAQRYTYIYTYTLDQDGYVTRMQRKDGGPETLTFDITYY